MPDSAQTKRPAAVTVLRWLMGFLSLGALWGGLLLMIKPGGSIVQIDISWLKNTSFDSYFLPGMLLFGFLGIFPGLVWVGLRKRGGASWMEKFNPYRDQHWAWAGSLTAAIILWIDMQILLIGYRHFIQTWYALYGVCILVMTLLPSVREYFRNSPKSEHRYGKAGRTLKAENTED